MQFCRLKLTRILPIEITLLLEFQQTPFEQGLHLFDKKLPLFYPVMDWFQIPVFKKHSSRGYGVIE